jgi:hypothetical protein
MLWPPRPGSKPTACTTDYDNSRLPLHRASSFKLPIPSGPTDIWKSGSVGAACGALRLGTRLAAERRARTPGAIWDERLLTRAGQVHVLSGMLDPERWADVAIAVLAASLVTRSPYRSA